MGFLKLTILKDKKEIDESKDQVTKQTRPQKGKRYH